MKRKNGSMVLALCSGVDVWGAKKKAACLSSSPLRCFSGSFFFINQSIIESNLMFGTLSTKESGPVPHESETAVHTAKQTHDDENLMTI